MRIILWRISCGKFFNRCFSEICHITICAEYVFSKCSGLRFGLSEFGKCEFFGGTLFRTFTLLKMRLKLFLCSSPETAKNIFQFLTFSQFRIQGCYALQIFKNIANNWENSQSILLSISFPKPYIRIMDCKIRHIALVYLGNYWPYRFQRKTVVTNVTNINRLKIVSMMSLTFRGCINTGEF